MFSLSSRVRRRAARKENATLGPGTLDIGTRGTATLHTDTLDTASRGNGTSPVAPLAIGTLAIALGMVLAPTAARAAPSSLSSVVLADTLPGLVASPAGPTNGPINASNLGLFGKNGTDAAGLARRLADGEVSGQLRFWAHRPPNGDGVVISAFEYRDPTLVVAFLGGMNSDLARVATGTFSVPGILGASGYRAHVSAAGTPATGYIVTFAQGSIAFEIQVITAGGDLTTADAVSIAARQSANAPGALRAPTPAPAPAPAGTSWAYRVGEVVGLVLLGILVVALVLLGVRRTRVRRTRVRPTRGPRSRARRTRVERPRPIVTAAWTAVPSPPSVSPEPAAPPRDLGWHMDPDHLSEQAYWDGRSWTARRRWNGATWVEATDEPRRQGGPPA